MIIMERAASTYLLGATFMGLIFHAYAQGSSCKLETGEGRGEKALFQVRNTWDTWKGVQGCIAKCLLLRQTNPRITGMRCRTGNWCWCIVRMDIIDNSRVSSSRYQSCYFERPKPRVLPGCDLKTGRKAARIPLEVTKYKQPDLSNKGVRECVLRCNKKRLLDPVYNGMEYAFNDCYCVRKLRKLRPATYWQKACFLTMPVVKVDPVNHTCTTHVGFGGGQRNSVIFTVNAGPGQTQECINLCTAEKTMDPTINGMSIFVGPASKRSQKLNNCRCWKSMTKIVYSSYNKFLNRTISYEHMKSCFLGDNSAKLPSSPTLSLRTDQFTIGAGVGGSEVQIEDQHSAQACLKACHRQKVLGYKTGINGARFGVLGKGQANKCFCEINMRGNSGEAEWISSYFGFNDDE